MMAGELRQPGRATTATTEVSEHLQDLLDALEHGQLFWFADWPVAPVPRSGALVYTVWDRCGQIIYVGMAGRGETSVHERPASTFEHEPLGDVLEAENQIAAL